MFLVLMQVPSCTISITDGMPHAAHIIMQDSSDES
jgi:hypothetical protein